MCSANNSYGSVGPEKGVQMDFRVGDMIYISDGKNVRISRIDGVRGGNLRVGDLLFDWCGSEVGVPRGEGYKIYPIEN